jgi:putative lipase involved disintegration of autophagic bodies
LGGTTDYQSLAGKTYGARGQVFTDQDNSIVAIAIKGNGEYVDIRSGTHTKDSFSTTGFDDAGASKKKRIEGNPFFSCLRARQQHFNFSLPSGLKLCYQKLSTRQALLDPRPDSRKPYYRAILDLHSYVTGIYSDSMIWLTKKLLGTQWSNLVDTDSMT